MYQKRVNGAKNGIKRCHLGKNGAKTFKTVPFGEKRCHFFKSGAKILEFFSISCIPVPYNFVIFVEFQQTPALVVALQPVSGLDIRNH
jgi:hypothetical protein